MSWKIFLTKVSLGLNIFTLSPIDVFVTYDGKRAADIAAPRYAVRHMIAAEVQFKRYQSETFNDTLPVD